MPVQPNRRSWQAIAVLLRTKGNALAVQGNTQRAQHLLLAASVLEQEAPPDVPGRTTRRQAKTAAKATRRQRPGADAAYRAALGVAPGAALPPIVGTAHSAGAARGGRGASTKGRGTNK